MAADRSLFTVSGRAIVLAVVIGIGAAALVASSADDVVWSALAPLCLIAFVLGAGTTFTVYFALNLLRLLFQRNDDSD